MLEEFYFQSKKMKLFSLDKNKIIYFLYLFFEKVTVLIFHFYFINKISKEFYGIFAQTTYISGLLSNILMFGVAIPFVILAPSLGVTQNRLLKFFKNFSLCIALIVLFALFISANQVSNILYGAYEYKSYLLVLSIYIFADLISEYYNLYNRINSKIITHSKFIFYRSLIRTSSLVLPFIILNDFLFSYLISALTSFIFIVIYSKNNIGVFSFRITEVYKDLKSLILSIFKDGSKFLTLFLLNIVSSLLINLILVNQFNLETLAVYSFNMMLASIPISILGYITFYSLTDFVNQFNISPIKGNQVLLKDAAFSLLIFLIIFCIFYFAYEFIFQSFLNEAYSNKKLFIVIFIANLLYMINNFIQFPILSEKKYSLIMIIVSLSLVSNISYIYLNIENISILTPVIGLLIANLTILCLQTLYILFLKYVK